MTKVQNPITTALAWCLAWGDRREPQFDLEVLQNMRQAINGGEQVPEKVRSLVDQVQGLQSINDQDFPETIMALQAKYSKLWHQETKIGLVYGGATKIKQYVFEAAKLPDIRGASALLDRINLIDIPAFFGHYDEGITRSLTIESWLDRLFPDLRTALIPELLIYYKGGNVLAFCPAAFVDDLANAIERRYTEETLTANSCAVGDTFKLLEIRFGLIKDEQQFWLDSYLKSEKHTNKLVEAYFGTPKNKDDKPKSATELRAAFKQRKNFNELVTQLAITFNQRRAGNITSNRPTRAFPPIFETHPYLKRDESDRRPAVFKADLPNQPNMSESLARKRLIGQFAKREINDIPEWYKKEGFTWEPREKQIDSWVKRFENFLSDLKKEALANNYYQKHQHPNEAQSLREISQVSKGFVAYIYADGNNMGGYIQNQIKTPEEYRQFSDDIFDATSQSVYYALAKYLHPIIVERDLESGRTKKVLVHPFEIITIGGDDVLLIVPADKALEIAKAIGEKFEEILDEKKRYQIPSKDLTNNLSYQRYLPENAPQSKSILSTSLGVLITADDTPIYYAERLVGQLLKSAKEKAKSLKDVYDLKGNLIHSYFGGTIDFLSMKSVTMISSNIKEFRKQGLEKKIKNSQLKLYATPYTLYELGGLIEVVKALKKADFPKSQLYQIRSLLEHGRHTAILNYRYFRIRLQKGQSELKEKFEEAWCPPKDPNNKGNLAPWMYNDIKHGSQDNFYETIWRDIVDIYDFIDVISDEKSSNRQPLEQEVQS